MTYFVAEMNDGRIFTIFDAEEYARRTSMLVNPMEDIKTMIETHKFISAYDDLGNPVLLNTSFIIAFRVMTQKF